MTNTFVYFCAHEHRHPPPAGFASAVIPTSTELLHQSLRPSHRSHVLQTRHLPPVTIGPTEATTYSSASFCAGVHSCHRPTGHCLPPQPQRGSCLQASSLNDMYGNNGDLRGPRQCRALEDNSRSFREEYTSWPRLRNRRCPRHRASTS